METKLKILNRERRGDAIRKISRDMNLSRNTVRKVIRDRENISCEYVRKKQPFRVLGDYLETVEKMLRDNKKSKPKLTARQLFEKLRCLGYKGSESSVSRYVKNWKLRDMKISPAACVPLSFAKGEAYQFDWSTEKIMIGDEIISVKVAHFVLCYSGKKFIYIYPNETQEMVFDAHIRAFAYFGGTPTRGIYDNMSTAVTKVLTRGERKWNGNFLRLCAHYNVEPTACNPASANEKGRVERQVAISRQNFFTPILKYCNIEEANNILTSQVNQYNRTHKHSKIKDKTLDELFKEESHCFVRNTVPFDGYKKTTVKATSTCLVRFDRNDYSVHCSCAGKVVECKSYAHKLVFISDGEVVATHARQFTKGRTYYDYNHYLPLLSRKPGALLNGAPFMNMELPEELKKVKERLEIQKNGSRDFAHILSYIPVQSMDSVREACRESLELEVVTKDVILNILLRKNDIKNDSDDLDDSKYPKLHHIPEANCNNYNNLLSGTNL